MLPFEWLLCKPALHLNNSPYARGVVLGLKRKLPGLRDCKKGNIEYIVLPVERPVLGLN
jgi:hypothetical protein